MEGEERRRREKDISVEKKNNTYTGTLAKNCKEGARTRWNDEEVCVTRMHRAVISVGREKACAVHAMIDRLTEMLKDYRCWCKSMPEWVVDWGRHQRAVDFEDPKNRENERMREGKRRLKGKCGSVLRLNSCIRMSGRVSIVCEHAYLSGSLIGRGVEEQLTSKIPIIHLITRENERQIIFRYAWQKERTSNREKKTKRKRQKQTRRSLSITSSHHGLWT